MSEAADLSFNDLVEGDSFQERYVIDSGVSAAFIAASGDRSPIHVDDGFAALRGFPRRVMHGAILNCFLSHFVGMRVPGRGALLHSAELHYLRPCFLDDHLLLRATIAQKSVATATIILHVHFENETQGNLVCRGRAQVEVRP